MGPMDRKIVCPYCGAETMKYIDRVGQYRWGYFLTIWREFKCCKCMHHWRAQKPLGEMRQDKRDAEFYGEQYPHLFLLERLEIEYATKLKRKWENNRKRANERIRSHWGIEIIKAKKAKDRSSLLYYVQR